MAELNIERCRELIAELRDLPNDYIAYAEELCPEVADKLEAALAEVERLKTRDEQWMTLVHEVGLRVDCLYSSFPDANGHILAKLPKRKIQSIG